MTSLPGQRAHKTLPTSSLIFSCTEPGAVPPARWSRRIASGSPAGNVPELDSVEHHDTGHFAKVVHMLRRDAAFFGRYKELGMDLYAPHLA